MKRRTMFRRVFGSSWIFIGVMCYLGVGRVRLWLMRFRRVRVVGVLTMLMMLWRILWVLL